MAHRLISRSGEAVPPVDVTAFSAAVDTSNGSEIIAHWRKDGCAEASCGLFLFALQPETFVDLLAPLGELRFSDPAAFKLGPFVRNGLREVLFGEIAAAWDGERYVLADALPRSERETGPVVDACNANRDLDSGIAQYGLDPAIAKPAYCGCLADRLEVTNVEQDFIDRFADYLGPTPPEEFDDAFLQTLAGVQDQETGCKVAGGWGYWPDTSVPSPVDSAVPQSLALEPLMNACIAQEELAANRKIRTPDRLLSFCGCVANQGSARGWAQTDVDALAGFYGGNLSERELEDQAPGLLDASDAAWEICVQTLPEARAELP